MQIREREIELVLRREALARGGRALKFVSPGTGGVPDRIVLLPGGLVCFVELKAPGRKPRASQQVMLRRLYGLGCRTATVDNAKSARRLIQLMEERYAVHRP